MPWGPTAMPGTGVIAAMAWLQPTREVLSGLRISLSVTSAHSKPPICHPPPLTSLRAASTKGISTRFSWWMQSIHLPMPSILNIVLIAEMVPVTASGPVTTPAIVMPQTTVFARPRVRSEIGKGRTAPTHKMSPCSMSLPPSKREPTRQLVKTKPSVWTRPPSPTPACWTPTPPLLTGVTHQKAGNTC